MGLMDLARGSGEGSSNMMNNQGNKRRGGGMKNNSTFVQRYLAAIDGEAIELLLPTSPKSRQQQPISPSGRSRSSHTTKSTKHTVRTAGSDSAVWNEVLTPSSASPLKSRRKLQPSQPPVSHSHKEDIAVNNRQSRSMEAPSSAAAKNIPSSPSNSTSPLRGLFPRSLLRNSSSQPANTTTKPSNSISSSLIRKWNTDHFRGNIISSSNGSMTTSTRPIPLSNTEPSPRRTFGKRPDASKYHRPSEDDDSSLTSRRTTESKESPYRDPRRGRSTRRMEDDDDDGIGDDDATSSYDDDDDDDAEESTTSGSYHISHHPQQQKSASQKRKAGPLNHFSIEKTFDQAVESGLDMILNTNAWTCAVPQMQPPQSTPSNSTPHIPRSTRDTQQMSTTTGSKPMATTPPAHQRRKQRHDDALLRHTLSADTPRSDVTGAATEIATNRAVDIAMKRIRDIEYNNNHQYQAPVASPVLLRIDPPPESQPTTTSINTTTMSRVKQGAKNFEQNKSNRATPVVVTNGLNRRTYENTVTPITVNTSGRLGLHFYERASKHSSHQLQIGEGSVETLKTLSSSVGVEIDDRVSRMPVSSTLKTYSEVKSGANFPMNRTQQPRAKDEGAEDWMNVPLLYGPENNNPQKQPADRPSYIGRIKVCDTMPSTPLISRYKLPSPSIGLHHTVDPCMSPPQIIRKSHSYDQVSPDPVFCSKSMSMSINSASMFSPQQSSNASVEASFQSEDAMFMEKLDESISTVVSNLQKGVESVQSGTTSNHLPKDTPEVSGHTDTTCETRTDEEGVNSYDNEAHSPYIDILGIRGRFPTAPVYYNSTITTPQQLHRVSSPQRCEVQLVPLVPFDSPSPPPLIDDALSISREYHGNISFNKDQMSSKADQFDDLRSPQQSILFHTTIAKPEPIRSRPTQFGGMHDSLRVKYSRNSALATKLSRTVASLNQGDVDVRSVGDVKSIRSAFESIMGSHEAAIENDDNDDDVASVRSLRERFEPPPLVSQTENGISKTRAIFEKNLSKNKSRPDIAANSQAGRILDRRVHHIDRNHRIHDSFQHDNLGEEMENDNDSVNLNSVNIDSTFEQKPSTVADRVRVFSGQNKSTKPYQHNMYGRRNMKTASSNIKPDPTTEPPAVLSFTSKRSPRNRMLNLRALGGKAFKCAPAKDSFISPDLDGIANMTSHREELLQVMQVDTGDHSTSNALQTDDTVNQFQVSTAAVPSNLEKICVNHVDNAHRAQARLSTSKPPTFQSKIEAKPLWMEQREKILSRSRNTSRVATAACESKRETALISSIGEKEISCNVEKEIVYVGDVRHAPLKGECTVKEEINSANPTSGNAIQQSANGKPTALSSSETLDSYHIHPQPAYQLHRSVSENLKPAYKLHRIMSENVRPSEKEYGDQLLPFCIQSPVSNEEIVNTNCNEATEDPTVGSSGLYDEKKEDDFEGVPLAESSKASAENKVESVVPEIVHYKQNNEKPELRPMVIKPVARKPYVRPVPLKPMIKSIPVIPFGRSVSDPTSNLSSKFVTTSTQINDADSRFVPRALVDKQYATLELPRLVEDILEPVAMEEILDSASESSEFSDGVTLDLSIADVSNLTNPTALISKIGGHHYEEDQTRSEMSSDERPMEKRNLGRVKRDNVGDAKQSEASSSQTSEAAAPLLARAMRTFPLSDEISTDSFFRDRAISAKKQWNTISHSNRSMPSYALFEENSKDDESRFGSDLDGIWDIRQVESLFPTSGVPKSIEQMHGSESQGVWQPFPFNSESNESPKTVTGNVSDIEDDHARSDVFAAITTRSQSKTPTRRNTTRVAKAPRLHTTVLLPTLQDEIPERGPNISNKHPSERATDEIQQWNYNYRTAAAIKLRLESEASYPLTSTASSNVSGKTARTIVSNLLSSSISGAPTYSDAYSVKRNTTSTIPASNKSNVSTSTVSTYGPKHSALLARIHALKESRLRRASRMASHSRPSTALAYQLSEQQHYY